MSPRCVPVCVILLLISGLLEAKLYYSLVFPAELRSLHPGNVCLHLGEAEGESNVTISLHMDGKTSTILDRTFQQGSIFTCIPVQITDPSLSIDIEAQLSISIQNAVESIRNVSTVIVRKIEHRSLVQTDKPVYNQGETVHIRVISLDANFQPALRMIPVVQLQNPNWKLIGQWFNVTLAQGLADLSFKLPPETPLGRYTIRLEGITHTFMVLKTVRPQFEVTLQSPKAVSFNSEKFPMKICGRYTFGKPVKGDYRIEVCRQYSDQQYWSAGDQRNMQNGICTDFTGKLDPSGCSTVEAKSETLNLTRSNLEMSLDASAYITEKETGVQLSTRSHISISNDLYKLQFVDLVTYYKPGLPYKGTLKLEDVNGNPISGQTVQFLAFAFYFSSDQTLVTNEKGLADFKIDDTTKLGGRISIKAKTKTKRVKGFITVEDCSAQAIINAIYSEERSFLNVHKPNPYLPCEVQQEIKVEYSILYSELWEKDHHIDLNYLITSRGSIQQFGSSQIPIPDGSSDFHGETFINLSPSPEMSSTLCAYVYIVFPDGHVASDSKFFDVDRCLKNKVSVGFSPDEVLPGSNVSLQVQAAPGSLCGIGTVDMSLALLDPSKELTDDKIFDLFPYSDSTHYKGRLLTPSYCQYGYYSRDVIGYPGDFAAFKDSVDADTVFRVLRKWSGMHDIVTAIKIEMMTNVEIENSFQCKEFDIFHNDFNLRMPVKTERTQKYFPETWIWRTIAVGDSGNADFHLPAPDIIADWNVGALCMGPSGIGLSPPASLRVSQPFFVDLDVPHSVERGETFIIIASVSNYLPQCIKVQTTLLPSPELTQEENSQYTECLCAEESKTFKWNLKATKLGSVNVKVRTEAINSLELCQNEIPVVPSHGSSNTITKPLLIQSAVFQTKGR
ncbi:alpha-2-macroglobulin-like [Rana temporaria]|uniref:alpha-2-macroglobulin-like n=1 Tax=Rana temporaria TaxID=8407 RepID=UPI001AACD88B|nr:alpha-2-macroglobulin-like [Rana temporaria]